jgi:diadenosine tetraphosphate (Ap4A) HIT family hydrolase
MTCPFCTVSDQRIVLGNALAFVIRDGFPVSDGHSLVIPRRHVASFFDLEPAEREAMLALLAQQRDRLRDELSPDGFNVGINDGVHAGQTVMHVHAHLIPRYAGDATDPRGGVRWVLPDKAAYWGQD